MRVALETANMYPGQGGVYTYYAELLRHLGRIPEPPELSLIEGLRYRDIRGLRRDLPQLDWGGDPMLAHAELIRPRRFPVGTLTSRPGPWQWWRGGLAAHAFDRQVMPVIRQRVQWNPVMAQWCLPPSRVGHVDLFHWSDTVFFHLPGRLHVATVHDTIPLTHPEWCTPEQSAYHSRHLRTVASHAARIIAVSESTRQDVIGALGVDADRIDVVPLGVSERFTQHASGPGLTALRHRYGLGNGSYVLYAGNTRPHKNLPRLIASVRAVMDAGSVPDLRLVLVGGLPQRDSPEVRAIESHRLGDRVAWLGRVPADDLPILMSGAAAVACVSLYEGFGLPALEAMAAGAPVVASDRSSFPEVVGDAGLLVDPYSERDIAQAVRRICTDPALAAQLRAKGMRRAQSFSWDRTARLTEESYRRAAACTGGRVG